MRVIFIIFLLFISCGSEISIDIFGPKDMGIEKSYFYASQKIRKDESEILSSWDRFGSGVALNESEDLLVVASWSDEVVSEESGSIRIFKKVNDNWAQDSIHSLETADISNYKKLGKSLAVSPTNNRIAAGLENLNNINSINTGGVYLFWDSGSGIEFKQRITLDHIMSSDFAGFGRHIQFSYDGGYLFVNALTEDIDGFVDAGALYIFKYDKVTDQYLEWQKIVPPSGFEAHTQFAYQFSISKDQEMLIVSQPFFSQESGNIGQIFKYKLKNGQYSYEERFVSPVDQTDFKFGRTVVCFDHCQLIAVTAQETVGGINLGKVFILNDKIEVIKEISPPEYSINGNTYFGRAISFNPSGSLVAISSSYRKDSRYTGKVYTYETKNFLLHQELQVNQVNEENNDSNIYFGISVYFGKNYLIAGGHTLSSTGTSAEGAAFIFEARKNSLTEFYKKRFEYLGKDANVLLGFKLTDQLSEDNNLAIINDQNLVSFNEYESFNCLELSTDVFTEYFNVNIQSDMSVFMSFYNISDELDKTLISTNAFILKTDASDEDRLVLTVFRGGETINYQTDNLTFHSGRWNQIQMNLFIDANRTPELYINGLKHILTPSGDSPSQNLTKITSITIGSKVTGETKEGCINELYFTDIGSIDPLEFAALKY